MKASSVTLTVLLGTVLSSSAFANTYVKCGKTADFDSYEVTGYELELSSEGADDYSGPVGTNWNMKLGSEDSEWLKPNKKITAKSYEVDGDTVVEITVKMAATPSGAVGTVYKLIGLYNEAPTLEKYTMGGFAGFLKVGTYQCLSGND